MAPDGGAPARNCVHCDEPLDPHEVEFPGSPSHWDQPLHRECAFRLLVGSLAHVEGRCSCYVPGADETDPPGMTRREAARAACRAWRRLNPGRGE